MKRLLVGATLIDAVAPRPRPASWLLVGDDGRIEAIGEGAPDPGIVAERIDLAGLHLVPGLWDVHVHPDFLGPDVPLAEQTARFGAQMTRATLESGIVGMRSAGAHDWMDVAWKKAYAAGDFVGPRLFACGWFLTTTGGHFLNSGHALRCDGPWDFVRAIREQIEHDVDHIKLNLSGGIMGPAWDLPEHSFLLEQELTAAFDLCRLRGVKVMAHATNPAAVQAAIRLGAHSIEHGYAMDDRCIELLLGHGTWYVPTLSISHLTPSQAGDDWERRWVKRRMAPPALCCRADAAVDVHRHWFRRALEAGVRMAIGSDIRPLAEAALLEMGCWARDGATPWQILRAATADAAALCGADDMGTVEAGKRADLVAVHGDPLADSTALRDPAVVLLGGRPVADRRTPSG